jgi:light-regulated signal transduction histidine kinase (bacteriophytochrome)
MMGYKGVYCEKLKQKNETDADSASRILHNKRRADLVNELVDPICVISNANEILSKRLSRYVDTETRAYLEMIARAATKTKTLIEELKTENNPI